MLSKAEKDALVLFNLLFIWHLLPWWKRAWLTLTGQRPW